MIVHAWSHSYRVPVLKDGHTLADSGIDLLKEEETGDFYHAACGVKKRKVAERQLMSNAVCEGVW